MWAEWLPPHDRDLNGASHWASPGFDDEGYPASYLTFDPECVRCGMEDALSAEVGSSPVLTAIRKMPEGMKAHYRELLARNGETLKPWRGVLILKRREARHAQD